jgi:hypothetical protein
MIHRGAVAPSMVAAALVVSALGGITGARMTLALMTGSATVSGNTVKTGTWVTPSTWYLHNNPTPPVADTPAQFNLPLTATVPTATTLRNYDTNCDTNNGRSIRRGAGAVTEATTCLYATWRSAALPATRMLTGTATLTIWARKSGTGTNPTLRAYLRVFDPGTSSYVELGSRDAPVTTGAWASYSLTWAPASVLVPAGRQIEIRIVATGGTTDPEISYDRTANPTSLALP